MPNPADTLTLKDLSEWNRRDQAGNFLPSLAVLGHPVAHSVSPQMHNAALTELAKQHPQLKDWCYFKFDIEPLAMDEPLAFFRTNNFKGLNLTIPHKIFITKFTITRSAGDVAPASINTLWPAPGGGWEGESTDGYGLEQSIKHDLGASISGREMVILGTGGAARATLVHCIDNHCGDLWVGGRKPSEEMQLDHFFGRFFREKRIKYFDIYNPPTLEWKPNAIVINATSLGLKVEDTTPIDVKLLPPDTLVLDMIYRREGGSTALVSAARARGLRATDGLGMLVWQGAKSLTMWIKAAEGIEVKPEAIAQTMMTAACQALGLTPRHV